MKYCRYCGGQLEDVAQVCVHCGLMWKTDKALLQPQAKQINRMLVITF